MRTIAKPKTRVRPRRVAPAAAITASMPQWRAWLRDPWTWVVAAGCALVFIMSLGGISQLLNRDEGAFLSIAYEVQHGRLPYRDAFDQKGPAIYYFLAAVLTLTAPLSKSAQILVARGAVLLLDLATAAGLVALGRRWWRLEVGVLAALLWLFAHHIYAASNLHRALRGRFHRLCRGGLQVSGGLSAQMRGLTAVRCRFVGALSVRFPMVILDALC